MPPQESIVATKYTKSIFPHCTVKGWYQGVAIKYTQVDFPPLRNKGGGVTRTSFQMKKNRSMSAVMIVSTLPCDAPSPARPSDRSRSSLHGARGRGWEQGRAGQGREQAHNPRNNHTTPVQPRLV